jgi:hypothetical protein
MHALRAIGFAAALALVAATGAAVALLLLSSIGGPDDDPVGRLRPVLPGLPVQTDGEPGSTAPATTVDDDGDRNDADDN